MEFDYSKEPGKRLLNRNLNTAGDPLVSIITPFYNAGKYFEQTYNCLMNQTFPWFEWIIVDDGSTDLQSIQLLEHFEKTDLRIHVYHRVNSGAAGARNHGIRKSKSDIIVFLDADDLIEKQYLEYVYIALWRNPQATWAYTDSCAFGEQEYLWQKYFSSNIMKQENILSYIAAIRKRIFIDESLYDDDSKNMWEDYQLWLKMLAKGYYPVRIPIPLFWYRRLSSGMLSKIDRDLELKSILQSRIKELASKVPEDIHAIIYSEQTSREFQPPKLWDWDRTLPSSTNKINLLLLLPHLEMGGADKFNLDFLKSIDQSKYSIGIISTSLDINEWRQEFNEYCEDIFDLPKFLEVNDWAAFIHYYIKSRNVSVVLNISSFYGYYIFPWLRKEFPNIGLIDYVHADAGYWRNGGYTRTSAAFQDIIETTIVANQATCDIMVNKYGKKREKCVVSYIGTDEKYFDPLNVQSGLVRTKMNIASDRPVVLYLCRISQEKRPLLMVEVARELKKKITDVCFLVVGDGGEMEILKDKISEYHLEDTVLLAGSQKEVRSYFKDSDVLLITSIKEGLTLTTFEAMAMKLPVISADVGGQKEAVNSKTGRLISCLQDEEKDFLCNEYQQEEIDDYVSALYDFLSNPKLSKETGEYCRKVIQEQFSFHNTVEEIDRIISANVAGEGLEKRHELSKTLRSLPSLADELLTIYCSYETKQQEAGKLWEGRNWFEQLYKNELAREHGTLMEVVPADATEAQRKLEEIYRMRSWHWIEKYRHFMDDTMAGRIIKKIINLFRR